MNILKKKIAIIGLGYVGLPLILEFAKKFDVVGYDSNKKRIDELKNGIDNTNEINSKGLNNLKKINFSNKPEALKEKDIYIITVPTPIDKNKRPNLKFLKSASKTVAKFLKKNDIVIYESTVFPGCTEEVCIPILEKYSGLSFNKDFFCGYSPERVNPGDKKRKLSQIIKVTSGSNTKTAKLVDDLYKSIIIAGTFKASSIAVAEAAKVIENTQRDLNIALMNELALIFRKMNINTRDVLKAANTKWNFLDFKPGLVGGHCIGVDPYYLTYKAKKKGFEPNVILSGRKINDQMGTNISSIILSEMNQRKIKIKNSQILIMGFTFKENCPDIRNTKVVDLINSLEGYGAKVSIFDPIASKDEAKNFYKVSLKKDLKFKKKFHAVIFAVEHKEIKNLSPKEIKKLITKNGFTFDVKNTFEKTLINANL
ncbi:nucleotide sugar dehydrogenase [Gammaproteobacteria bacterium]|nr:nucleotide sugar dehydrogenase [Gammaproteobacteria bacterium]